MVRRRDSTSSVSESDSESNASDEELQEAFAKGLLKPGLNQIVEKSTKTYSNKVEDMKMKTKEMQLNLPWVETLDLISEPAPMAPDVAMQMQDTTQRQINIRNNNAKLPSIDISEDPVLNEFKRETLFHRQAQASVLEAIGRLHKLGIVTKRPEIYFAEMAKTDVHMQKVRQNLMAKQAGQARAEKVRQIRQHKKMAKQIQAETKQQRALEKKTTLNEVKKYRKGLKKQDDFDMDGNSSKKNDGRQKKSMMKKNMKNKKFGFGGKKKGSKLNTRESSSDFGDLHGVKKNKNAFKNKMGGGGGGGGKKNKRPGKSNRISAKSKRRK